uniref:Uncharacterized protein n=1 Tax=Globodera rostochiensis TaxID=31243 RepID=A0A914H450_GLORO
MVGVRFTALIDAVVRRGHDSDAVGHDLDTTGTVLALIGRARAGTAARFVKFEFLESNSKGSGEFTKRP